MADDTPKVPGTLISWSGRRSQLIARALKSWLRCFDPEFDPWMSTTDLTAGKPWSDELLHYLETADAGILCITPENLNSPWLIFEAGALSRNQTVIPYLIDVSPDDLPSPLQRFQAAAATEDGTLRILKALGLRTAKPSMTVLLFEKLWPKLSRVIALSNAPNPKSPAKILQDLDDFREARRSLKLLEVEFSPKSVSGGQPLQIEYVIRTDVPGIRVWLGAAICGRLGEWYNNQEEDLPLIFAPGYSPVFAEANCSREFHPENIT